MIEKRPGCRKTLLRREPRGAELQRCGAHPWGGPPSKRSRLGPTGCGRHSLDARHTGEHRHRRTPPPASSS